MQDVYMYDTQGRLIQRTNGIAQEFSRGFQNALPCYDRRERESKALQDKRCCLKCPCLRCLRARPEGGK